MTAHGARRAQAQRDHDELAWMVGHYVAVGVNAPRKYPRRPRFTREEKRTRTMTDGEMLSALRAFAARHNTEVVRGGADDRNAAN